MSTLPVRVQSLQLHPIKSCAGIAVDESLLVETGLDLDRHFVVVDEQGRFLSQRSLPRMQLVRPTLRSSDMVLRAPGMLALHVLLDTVESPCRVTVWDDSVPAWDMGDLAAQWFSDFLGCRARLARFDPAHPRISKARWTGDTVAPYAFADAFALLVASTASLDELNRRLAAAGEAPVGMERFRPNIVLEGLDAHGEDFVDEIVFEGAQGPVRLRLVKPCSRCSMPDVDPATAQTGHAVADALAGYRADPRVGGALTFGMNAIVLEGADRVLRVGDRGQARVRF